MRLVTQKPSPHCPYPRSQLGITLIELMIALVIGLLATGAMLKVYVDSSRLYRFNESLARIQENGRFGLEFIRRDARMAGFWGCNSAVDPVNQLTPDTTLPDILLNGYVTGINDDGPNGSDSITFAQAASSSIEVTDEEGIGSASSASSLVPAEEYRAWEADRELLIITDCVTADIFQYNSETELSKTYAAKSRIYRVQRIKYFIAPGADPEQDSLHKLTCPALGDCTGEGDEIVEGIENMQILFGDDIDANDDGTDGDGTANRYLPPKAPGLDMDKVISVRIFLLARSLNDNLTTEQSPYDFVDFTQPLLLPTKQFPSPDKRLRKEFTTTVALRNKNWVRTEDVSAGPVGRLSWEQLFPSQ